jgi:DNA polymerase III epsilon subunit-like protein
MTGQRPDRRTDTLKELGGRLDAWRTERNEKQKIVKWRFTIEDARIKQHRIPMPFGASAVNNITDDMLKDKPSLDAVFPDFFRFVKDTVIISHNAPIVSCTLIATGHIPLKQLSFDMRGILP